MARRRISTNKASRHDENRMKNTKLSLSLPRLDHFLHKSRLLFNAKNCSRRPVKWIKNSSLKIYSNLPQNPFQIVHDLAKNCRIFSKIDKFNKIINQNNKKHQNLKIDKIIKKNFDENENGFRPHKTRIVRSKILFKAKIFLENYFSC